MILSDKLIKEFAKQIIGETQDNKRQTAQVLGTVKVDRNELFVKIDGSDIFTPVEYTVGYSEGDRVIVQLKDRTATIIGNYSDPSTSNSVVYDELNNKRLMYAYAMDESGNGFSLTNNTLPYRGMNINYYDSYILANPQPTESDFGNGEGFYILVDGEYIEQSNESYDPELEYYILASQPEDPSSYIWEINPYYASRMASDYISENYEEQIDGIKVSSPNFDSTTYLGLTATKMAFYSLNKLQASFGYNQKFASYGMEAPNVLIKGNGSGLRFDNEKEDTDETRGRFVFVVRDNGHLSLKPL